MSGWIATMTATRAEATPKAIMWMRCTLTPQTWATSRLWETARMALPSRVFWRNRKAATVMRIANPQAMTRDLEKAKGPKTKEPVRYSTERRSEVNASWARLTMAMDTPKVSSSEDSSGASTTRPTSVRWSARPTRNSTGMDTSRER